LGHAAIWLGSVVFIPSLNVVSVMRLTEKAANNKTVLIDATYFEAHRTVSSLLLKRGVGA